MGRINNMEQETYTRRSFLGKLWIVLGTVTFVELVVMVIAFFKPRKPRT